MVIPSGANGTSGITSSIGNNDSNRQSNDGTNTAVNFNNRTVALVGNTAYLADTSNEYKPESKLRSVEPVAPNNNNDKGNSSPIENIQEQISNELANLKEVKFNKILPQVKYALLATLVAIIISIALSITVSVFFLIPLFLLPIFIPVAVASNICSGIVKRDIIIGENIGLQFLDNIFKNYKKPDQNINLSYEKLQTCLSSALKKSKINILILDLFYSLYCYSGKFNLPLEAEKDWENTIKNHLNLLYELLFTELQQTFAEAHFDMDELTEAKNVYIDSLTIGDMPQLFKQKPNSINKTRLTQALLGLSLDSNTNIKDLSEKEVNSAYKKQALKLHPDKNRDNPNADKAFHDLTEYRSFLLNAIKLQN